MTGSLFFEIPISRSTEVTEALLRAVPKGWVMVDGPIEHRGCALFCKEARTSKAHVARCHIVPEPWTGSFLNGREEGPQPPRIKLAGDRRLVGRSIKLCQALGLVQYEPRVVMA